MHICIFSIIHVVYAKAWNQVTSRAPGYVLELHCLSATTVLVTEWKLFRVGKWSLNKVNLSSVSYEFIINKRFWTIWTTFLENSCLTSFLIVVFLSCLCIIKILRTFFKNIFYCVKYTKFTILLFLSVRFCVLLGSPEKQPSGCVCRGRGGYVF